jgi:predicted acyltransferase (DUF342 family)
MVTIPFLIAIKELLKPKDNKPLYINMFHSKDPLYFGRAFKNKVADAIGPLESGQALETGTMKLRISKSEPVEICDTKAIPDDSRMNHIFYIRNDFTIGDRTILRKDVYVKGDSRIGSHNALRTIYGEGDIRLGENCHVSRWLCSEKNIHVGPGGNLGRNAACTGRLELDPGCRFQSLFAGPVLTTGTENPGNLLETDTAEIMSLDYPTRIELPVKPAWKIIKGHISVNCDDECLNNHEDKNSGRKVCCGIEPGREPCHESHWHVTRDQVAIEALTTIATTFVARQELVVKEFCKIMGAIKGFKNVILKENVEVHGDIFAEGNIIIENNCTLLGNVFSQSEIYIGNGVRISRPQSIKSVIGKKKIEIGRNTLIFGYVLSEGQGFVK